MLRRAEGFASSKTTAYIYTRVFAGNPMLQLVWVNRISPDHWKACFRKGGWKQPARLVSTLSKFRAEISAVKSRSFEETGRDFQLSGPGACQDKCLTSTYGSYTTIFPVTQCLIWYQRSGLRATSFVLEGGAELG